METTGARVRPETFVPLMLLNEVNWVATAAYAASILRTLRRIETVAASFGWFVGVRVGVALC